MAPPGDGHSSSSGSGSDVERQTIFAVFTEVGELGIVLGPRDDHRALRVKQLLPDGQASRLRAGLAVGARICLLLLARPLLVAPPDPSFIRPRASLQAASCWRSRMSSSTRVAAVRRRLGLACASTPPSAP